MPPSIPSHHNVGDTGHTTDHNQIVDVLTDHEQRVAAIQAAQPTYMVKTGNNIITVSNPTGMSRQVIVPSGTRDNAVAVETVSVGGKVVFALDTYGMLRVDAVSTAAVPLAVSGYDNSHTGDLQHWKKYGTGAILSRVAADGTIYAPNITPGAWTNLTLAGGLAWASGLGSQPQYRVTADKVELRGSVRKANSTDFTVSPQNVGTLPPAASPPYPHVVITAANMVDDEAYVRLTVETSGLIRFYFRGGFTPNWISLDNTVFSRLP